MPTHTQSLYTIRRLKTQMTMEVTDPTTNVTVAWRYRVHPAAHLLHPFPGRRQGPRSSGSVQQVGVPFVGCQMVRSRHFPSTAGDHHRAGV